MKSVCERIKPIDISPLLASIDGLAFVAANRGSVDPQRSPCSVVLDIPQSVKAFVAGLGLGGETKRIIFRKLAAHQGMPPHTDTWLSSEASWRRFQVPITSHPDIKMCWPDDGIEEHLEPGWLYEVRFDRTHEVINNTNTARIHLQVDQVNATI